MNISFILGHLLDRITHAICYIGVKIDRVYQFFLSIRWNKYVVDHYLGAARNNPTVHIKFLVSLRTDEDMIVLDKMTGILPNTFTYDDALYEYTCDGWKKDGKPAPFNSICL
jgi:hypothetical protein